MSGPLPVLFLCTANSCRSQMAEGLLRHHGGNLFQAFSAGTRPSMLNPNAIRVMSEVGCDISHQRSKSVDEFQGQPFDYLVTVCDQANESCPVFPAARARIHWSLPDPARAEGSEEERLRAFRQVRDNLSERIQSFVSAPQSDTADPAKKLNSR